MGIYKVILLTLLTLSSPLALAEDDSTEELLTAGELLKSCEDGSTPGSPNQYCMRFLFQYIQTLLMLQQACLLYTSPSPRD